MIITLRKSEEKTPKRKRRVGIMLGKRKLIVTQT